MSESRLRSRLGVLALGVALVAAACAEGSTRSTFPPIGSTPQPAGNATAAARAEVVDALATAGLQTIDAVKPYRPPEGALFAAAPRTVLQAQLPDDPDHGFIVLYAFGSGPEAKAAAEDHAAFVARNQGAIFPKGTRAVLRIVGSSAVSFAWLPEGAADPRTRSIEDALLTIGSGVPIPG